MLKPPQPKPQPPVTPKYTEPPTVPIPPINSSPKEKVTVPKQTPVEAVNKPQPRVDKVVSSSRRVPGKASDRDNSESDRISKPVGRRKWLKYSSLGVGTLIISLLGKNIWDSN